MYFKRYPTITYPFYINGKLVAKKVTDITINVRIVNDILANITSYDEYDMGEGETPEIVAERAYGSPLYHWVIMITNQRFDYKEDFPLSNYELEQYIFNKYGQTGQYETHHFVDGDGNIVNEGNKNVYGETEVTYPISNYQYEADLNESKRRIKLISQENLFRILAQFKSLI